MKHFSRWLTSLLMISPLAALASLEGRWEGQLVLPGVASVPVILDAHSQGNPQRLVLTLPGRAIQGRVLSRIEQQADGWTSAAAGDAGDADAVQLRWRLAGAGLKLEGEWRQGGHTAPLNLVRSGPAPAADAIPATPLSQQAWGTWHGSYNMGFGPREATLRLSAEGAVMRVVGRRTTDIRFDEAVQRGNLLMLNSQDMGISLEAPAAGLAGAELAATIRQGPFEATFALRREVRP